LVELGQCHGKKLRSSDFETCSIYLTRAPRGSIWPAIQSFVCSAVFFAQGNTVDLSSVPASKMAACGWKGQPTRQNGDKDAHAHNYTHKQVVLRACMYRKGRCTRDARRNEHNTKHLFEDGL